MNKYKRLYIRFLKEEKNFSYKIYGNNLFEILTSDCYLPSAFPFDSFSTRKKYIEYIYPIFINDLKLFFKDYNYNIKKNKYYLNLKKAMKNGSLYSTIFNFVSEIVDEYQFSRNEVTRKLINQIFNRNE